MEFCDGLHHPYPLFCQENWYVKSDSISKIQKFWRNYKLICKIENFRKYVMQKITRCMLPGCNIRHYNTETAKKKHMNKVHKIKPYTIGTEQVYEYIKKNDYTELCGICLESLSNGEIVNHLPNCTHPFHMKCIDVWLDIKKECPICKETAGIKYVRPGKWEADLYRRSIAKSTLCYEYVNDYQCLAITKGGWRCTNTGWYHGYCGKH